ncbi:unnamed protein product [Dovyalis caffra]|uniref:Uncharacterized protein n=1 Tax=Dovyalis caffra TaxID=77055 RepID=A0AAV1R0V0_9ROSI|nr:unnamed protein product [Dovyalis caffra]
MKELWLGGRGKGLVRCIVDDEGAMALRCEDVVDAVVVDRQGVGKVATNEVMIGGGGRW